MTTTAISSAHRYGELERERGLLALAMANGVARRAARELAADKENPLKVTAATLTRWRAKESERYEEQRREILPQIRAQAAEQHMALATRNMEVAEATTKRQLEKLAANEVDAKDLSSYSYRAAIATGVFVDKATLHDAQLTDQRPMREVSAIVRSLKARGVDFQENVIEAKVVAEDDIESISE